MTAIQKSFHVDDLQFEHVICAIKDDVEAKGVFESRWCLTDVLFFFENVKGMAVPVLGMITFTPSDDGTLCDIWCESELDAEFIYKRFNEIGGVIDATENSDVPQTSAQTVNG
jgi:hypothetical protein